VKIESLSIENFRCFGPKPTKIDFETGVTAFVGGNGSGKTAAFQALSRLCGVTAAQRTVRRQDFHLAVNQQELESGGSLSIDAIFSFPELDDLDEDALEDAVPEFFFKWQPPDRAIPLRSG
jgi:putative ATP-dependent endonuclease of the OLD family